MGKFRAYVPGDKEEVSEPPVTTDGHPALWEWGGMTTDTGVGQAVIVAGPDGEAKVPAEVPVDPAPNGRHALVTVALGDRVIHATRWPALGDEVEIWLVTGVEADKLVLTLTHYHIGGEWDPAPPDGILAAAVQAALDKASCRECKEPHWIRR